ncbi:MAG: threonine synthase [Chitinophagaceae bacterium]|nr:MAG: threonine synthase [Chitinophagaceae bacterium]
MIYYSLNGAAPAVDFRTAVINGQAPDKGLYFPGTVPVLDAGFWSGIGQHGDLEIAQRIIAPYTGDAFPEAELERIVADTLSFPVPLVPVSEAVQVLELFHGPTLAFKDVGARFMSRCLSWFARGLDQRVLVLVATSGDTGGAVAAAFEGVPHVEVLVLYPAGRVSPVQEAQIAGAGANVHALEVAGNFDDCQALVKEAFADPELRRALYLTSANSINVARWLPQQFYYALAWKQWPHKSRPPVLSVPSGNFGNIGAALLLHRSGLPVRSFVAACNANDGVARRLAGKPAERRVAIATLSNAMDVADPSNFVRILELFGGDSNALQELLRVTTTTDEETRATIRGVYNRYGYVLDPHSAVAWHGLEQVQQPGASGIVVGTAHPVKFPAVVAEETGTPVAYPPALSGLMERPLRKEPLAPVYEALRARLLQFR